MPNPLTTSLSDTIRQMLPPYGPYSAEASIAASDGPAHLIRYLNHATRHPEAVPYPVVSARILGNLHAAVADLPQLVDQLAGRARSLDRNPHAYVYRGADGRNHNQEAVTETVSALRTELSTVAQMAAVLAQHLSTAQSLANRLGVNEPDPWDGQ